jgi:hypothetical protein
MMVMLRWRSFLLLLLLQIRWSHVVQSAQRTVTVSDNVSLWRLLFRLLCLRSVEDNQSITNAIRDDNIFEQKQKHFKYEKFLKNGKDNKSHQRMASQLQN